MQGLQGRLSRRHAAMIFLSVIKRYTERQPTAYEHSWEIRAAYGYRDFADQAVHEPLVEFIGARAWIHAEGAVALFEQAQAWLRGPASA